MKLPASKFRVEVDIRGLCMLVPGTDDHGKDVLHVLMPKTGHNMPGMPAMGGGGMGDMGAGAADGAQNGNGTSVMEHLPRVVYSLDYEPKPNPSVPVFNEGVANLERVIDLPNGTLIDWSGAAAEESENKRGDRLAKNGAPGAADPLSQLIDIVKLVKSANGTAQDAAVNPKLLSGSLPEDGPCAVRITLPGSTIVTPYNFRGLSFAREDPNLPSPPRKPDSAEQVATCALCVFETTAPGLGFDVDGARLELTESAGVIRVMFGNTIESDYQHPPRPLDTTGQRTHFWGFYPLIAKAPSHPSVPDVPSHLGAPSTTCTICLAQVGMHSVGTH